MDANMQRLRRMCQTDLVFLATEVLKFKLDDAQRTVCDFFVHKDPDIPLENLDPIKERLLLYPRRIGKSFLNVIDCVQWIICYPDIKIAIQTGEDSLATAFVGAVKDFFKVPGWDGVRNSDGLPTWNENARPTAFQELFSEFCLYEKKAGTADAFTHNARTHYDKDPTVYSISISSNNSGWGCHVLKNDDILTDQNTREPKVLQKIDDRFHMSHKLMLAGGYRDTIGTRYDTDDTYGRLMKKRGIKEDMPYGYILTKKIKYLCMPAWWIKGTGSDGTKEFTPPLMQAGEIVTKPEFVEIISPRLTYDFLADDMELDPKSHASQYLNNPVLAGESTFLRGDLLAAKVPYNAVPYGAHRAMTVDLAYSDKKGRDFTVFAIGDWIDDSLFLSGLIRDRFKPDDMAFQIVQTIVDYNPEKVAIEDMPGAQWLRLGINMEAERRGLVLPPIEWLTLSNDRNDKDNRIQGLSPLLREGRFKILNDIPDVDRIVIDEFARYGSLKNIKKDVPDAVSRLLRFQHSWITAEEKEERRAAWQKMKEDDQHDAIFGEGRYAYRPTDPSLEELQEPEVEPEYDQFTGLPSGDIFR